MALSLSACSTVQTPSGPITWIAPLPYGSGSGVSQTSGVTITPITVRGNGSSASYTVISPVRGK
jgi:hypothetical protein